MPWIEEQEGNHKPHEICRCQRHDDREEKDVGDNVVEIERMALSVVLVDRQLYRFDGDEDGREHQVHHDADPEIHHRHIEFIGALGTVS